MGKLNLTIIQGSIFGLKRVSKEMAYPSIICCTNCM